MLVVEISSLKMIRLIIIPSVILALFSSCKKNDDGTSYSVSGTIYEDCNGQPAAGLSIELLQDVSGNVLTGQTSGGTLATTTTDANGNFSFEYNDQNPQEISIISRESGNVNHIMSGIPWRTNLSGLIAYRHAPTTNIQVAVNVINAHTANDTLVIADYTTMDVLKIPGPFQSGILYTAVNFPLLTMEYNGEKKYLNWYFNQNTSTHQSQEFIVNRFCSDTIKVVANIN